MGEVKQINIKNRTYYFYNDIINLKNFNSNLLKIDKKSYKNIDIYNIGYITIKKIDDCENIYSVNPLYFLINHGTKNKIKEVSSDECDHEKDYMKIKFNSDDDLPLNKPLKFHNLTIIIRSNCE